MLYAIVNTGWFQKDIVLNPETQCFELVDYLDKTHIPETVIVESIQKIPAVYKKYEKASLLKFKKYCRERQKSFCVDQLYGYPDLCENYAFLADIFENGSVPLGRYPICIPEPEDRDIWTYIETQQDADAFMELFAGFHDAYLTDIVYSESQSYTSAVATFDNSGWYGIVELCFEGVQTLHIKPAGENFDVFIHGATLTIKDEIIYWADDIIDSSTQFLEENALANGCSCIAALNLKWRKIG